MIKELLQEGFVLKTKGYYKHAIEAFYKALELDNSSAELLLEIADSYFLMGDEERALSYIESILEKNPTHIGSMKLLKKIFVSKQAWNEAEQVAQNVYLISKDLDDLAELYELLNKQKKYAQIFVALPEEKSPKLLYEMAYAKLFLSELADAENYINQALEEVSDKSYLLLKCKILFKLGKKDECLEFLENLKLDKTDADMLNFIGLVKQYECEYEIAIKLFAEASKIEPQKDEYFYNIASTYFKMGDISQAKKYYNIAISINPENQSYHFALANLYYSEKNYKRAMEELKFDFFESNLLKAIILYDTGYLALARKKLVELEKERPNDEMVLRYKTVIEEELKI